MPAGHNSPPESTLKFLPSAPGSTKWLDVMRGKRRSDERWMTNWQQFTSHLTHKGFLTWSGDNWYNFGVHPWITGAMMLWTVIYYNLTYNLNEQHKATADTFWSQLFNIILERGSHVLALVYVISTYFNYLIFLWARDFFGWCSIWK